MLRDARNDGDMAARLVSVHDLHQKSQLIEGTIAETYLRQERGITCKLSEDLRFLPKGTIFTYNDEPKTLAHECFAAFARNAKGELYAVQLTKLNDDGTQTLDKQGEKLNKIQYGVSKGSFVTLQIYSTSSRVFICEGLETGLSIKEAGISGTIVASLGIHNIKNYKGPEQKVIICADHDGLHTRTNAVIEDAQKHFQNQSKSVVVIRPQTEGHNFNDVPK